MLFTEKEITTTFTELPLRVAYNLQRNPVRVPLTDLVRPEDLEEGLMCQSAVNTVERALGVPIPDGVRSSEWGAHQQHGIPVEDTKIFQTGTVIGVTREEETDPKRTHLVVVQKVTEGGIHVIHASREQGRLVVCTLADLLSRPEYAHLAFAKHPTRRDPDLVNPELLRLFGIEEPKL